MIENDRRAHQARHKEIAQRHPEGITEPSVLFESLRQTPLCQRWDTAVVTLGLPAETEEWASDALDGMGFDDVWRDENGVLYVKQTVGGNTNALAVAAGLLRDVEDALQEAQVDPSHLILRVDGVPGSA